MKTKTITISESASLNKKSIKVYEIKNSKATKNIYLQAGLHGTELTGTPILFELINQINQNPKEFENFNFSIVPICNPESTDSQIMGLQTGYNNIHTNPQNCINYNRPNLNKVSSIEYNHFKKLLKLTKTADIVIDLHTSGAESLWHLYCHKSLVKMAKNFGINHIIGCETKIGCFEDICFDNDKQAYTLECGPSRILSQSNIEKGIQAIKSFLNLQTHNIKYNIIQENQIQSIYSPKAGFLIWKIQTGESFKKGQKIAEIIWGVNKKHTIQAKSNGIFFIKRNIHAPFQNQEIAQVIYK